MDMFGVIGDTARSASSLNVQFSDDDWQTLSAARTIDMTSGDKMLTRCGSYKDRGVRLADTELASVAPWVDAGWARVEGDAVRLTALGWLRLDSLAGALTHVRSRY